MFRFLVKHHRLLWFGGAPAVSRIEETPAPPSLLPFRVIVDAFKAATHIEHLILNTCRHLFKHHDRFCVSGDSLIFM